MLPSPDTPVTYQITVTQGRFPITTTNYPECFGLPAGEVKSQKVGDSRPYLAAGFPGDAKVVPKCHLSVDAASQEVGQTVPKSYRRVGASYHEPLGTKSQLPLIGRAASAAKELRLSVV